MNATKSNNKKLLMAQYLLGELSESEKTQIEDSFFASDEDFAELLAVEENLIAEYLSGELSPETRQRFERHFLASPRRRQSVELTRDINRTVTRMDGTRTESTARERHRLFAHLVPSQVAVRWAFGAAALALLLGTSWAIWQTLRLKQEVNRLEAENASLHQQKQELERARNATQESTQQLSDQLSTERLRRSESEEQLVDLQRRSAAQPQTTSGAERSSIVTFLLSQGLTRDVQTGRALKLPTGARTVILNLELNKNEYQNYQTLLQTPEGREVWRREDLKARQTSSGPTVSFPVPARLMPAGDYILSLRGINSASKSERIGEYAFTVVAN